MGEDMIQDAELVLPVTNFKVAGKIKEILSKIDDPYKIYFSISMICLHG